MTGGCYTSILRVTIFSFILYFIVWFCLFLFIGSESNTTGQDAIVCVYQKDYKYYQAYLQRNLRER